MVHRQIAHEVIMPEITKSKCLVICDEEDYPLLSEQGWTAKLHRGYRYVIREFYRREGGKKIYVSRQIFHRLIMNCPDDMMVDHINGNTLDNRKENLRICTHTQNTRNKVMGENANKWGVPGLWFDKSKKRKKKFRLHIWVDNKKIHLGNFLTIAEAAEARIVAEKKYYGEFSPAASQSLTYGTPRAPG